MELKYGEYICRSKVKYRTKDIAWDYALHFFKIFGDYQTPYKCTYCKAFHLTKRRASPKPCKKFIRKFNKWFGRKVLD